jgi:MFS family permease
MFFSKANKTEPPDGLDNDNKPPTPSDLSIEETEKARIDRLSRQRPAKLSSTTREVLFLFSITTSQLLTEFMVSGFTILLPTVTNALDIPRTAATWPASAFSLVVSALLLPFGRLGDMYGGYPVYITGVTWFAVLSLAIGFSTNYTTLVVLRAFQGLGPAAYLPAGLQLLGSMYRPGPRKNLAFFAYGAMAAFGFFVGVLFAGIAGEFLDWRWYFWLGAIFIAVVAVVSVFAIPSDVEGRRDNGVVMDWWGSLTIVSGLILVVFAITDSSHAPDSWATPYIIATFILGWILLGVAFCVEGWVAEQPLLPFEMFKVKGMLPFVIGLLFAYGPLGIYLLYATLL